MMAKVLLCNCTTRRHLKVINSNPCFVQPVSEGGMKIINHFHAFLVHVCLTFSKYFDLKSMAWHQNILLSVQYFLLPTWSILEFRAVSFPKWIILIIWAAEASIVLFVYSCGYDAVINCSVKKCNSVVHLMI